jgi:hypothetical protein
MECVGISAPSALRGLVATLPQDPVWGACDGAVSRPAAHLPSLAHRAETGRHSILSSGQSSPGPVYGPLSAAPACPKKGRTESVDLEGLRVLQPPRADTGRSESFTAPPSLAGAAQSCVAGPSALGSVWPRNTVPEAMYPSGSHRPCWVTERSLRRSEQTPRPAKPCPDTSRVQQLGNLSSSRSGAS